MESADNRPIRVMVFTHDLTARNAHLMPWRTVCEVVYRGSKSGVQARLVSLGTREVEINGPGIPPGTCSIIKSKRKLGHRLESLTIEWDCDVIIWPVAWREPYWRIRALKQAGVPMIGYFPGGVYRLSDVMYLIRKIGLRKALPYVADAVWPKQRQMRLWKKLGVKLLVTMTKYTADVAVAHGWPDNRIRSIPPGRDSNPKLAVSAELPAEFIKWRKNRPFYLFAGPPSAIRGIYELLDAFESLGSSNDQVCLVCLFRSDATLETEKLAGIIGAMEYGDRVYPVWESLEKETLEAFMSECHCIVLPFVTVPSEIPLAIIEAMRYGKPVITTRIGGTGEFVGEFGSSVALGSIAELAGAMRRLLEDSDYYRIMCDNASNRYSDHITWDRMAKEWMKCAIGAVNADV